MMLLMASSFNPCFDGSVARVLAKHLMPTRQQSFNPCFDGSVARVMMMLSELTRQAIVSILVLMEV